MLKLSKAYRSEPKPERLNKMGLVIALAVFLSLVIIWEVLFAREIAKGESFQNDYYSHPGSAEWFQDKPDYIDDEKEEVVVATTPEIVEEPLVEVVIDDKSELYREVFSRGIERKFKLSGRANKLLDNKHGEAENYLGSLGSFVKKSSESREGGELLAKAQKSSSEYLEEEVLKPRSPYELKAGTVIPSLLITSIDSDLPGEVIGQVREDVFDSSSGQYLLIPKGTKIFGRYNSSISYGQERLLVEWNRLIFPNGSSLTLNGMQGSSPSGGAGFEANVNNHYKRVFGSAILMSVITAAVQLSQPQESRTGDGPSTGQTLAASLGQNIGNVAAEMTRKNLNIQPTLTQKYGYRFNVMVSKDIVFPEVYQT